MLDAITDFWKTSKKSQGPDKFDPDQLQIGSVIGFGFVPQTVLSGRRLKIGAVNTYQFGEETLTSFMLQPDDSTPLAMPAVSMIVAEADGEHYLAISRRINSDERLRLFTGQDIENIILKSDMTKLSCRENTPDFKGWVVASYRREIQGLKGHIFKGDFRKKSLPPVKEAQEFEYTLLVSDSNEHAVEIESFKDGRIEIYTTVYRRMSDIGEIAHPGDAMRPDIKLASGETSIAPSPQPTPVLPDQAPKTAPQPTPVLPQQAPATAAAQPQPVLAQSKPPAAKEEKPAQPEPLDLQEFVVPSPKLDSPRSEIPATAESKAPAIEKIVPPITTNNEEQEKTMTTSESAVNGAAADIKKSAESSTTLYVQSKTPETYMKQEIKAVTSNGTANAESHSLECDLQVANKVIDEAIRNEMRLTDIVRRIIELPVAYREMVQIPISLTEEDFALLAIRYGIPASDRNAIKRRILEDLNDFSGNGKKAS